MFTLTLTEQDINNLKIFLSRTQLSGQEVAAFSQIMQSIYEAKEEKPKKAGD